MAGMTTRVITSEGYAGLYAGLSAALLRQFTYSTIRFGVYEDLKSRLSHDSGIASHSPMVLICLSALSGFMGGVAGNPADIVNVRMQSDMSRPLTERRNYKHVFDGVFRIIRTEGVSSLYRGVGANALRASLMNSSQLASYDMAKTSCIKTFGMDDDTKTHLVASFMAGIVATTVCSPADVVKTRIMGSTNREHIWQILKRSTMSEGSLWVFKGWVPSFLRLGPQTVLTLLILEQHKKVYAKMTI
jgi:solute carrier family 25 (mitochondrial dicarboxylate transporter), member 10